MSLKERILTPVTPGLVLLLIAIPLVALLALIPAAESVPEPVNPEEGIPFGAPLSLPMHLNGCLIWDRDTILPRAIPVYPPDQERT